MDILTLNNDKFKKTCLELGSLIETYSYKPDIIIGVKTGGAYVSQNIIKMDFFRGCKYFEILLQRRETKYKSIFKLSNLLKRLPYKLLNKLRILEARYNERSYSKKEHGNYKKSYLVSTTLKEIIIQSNTLLIIDDAVDSGNTMLTLIKQIQEINPNIKIKTASITVTFKKPLVIPDFTLMNQILVRFPWSNDFKE